MTTEASATTTDLHYRGKRVKVHHGHLDPKECPWLPRNVFTCSTCKRVCCWCYGGAGSSRCDECDNAGQDRVVLAAERLAAKGSKP